MRTRITRLFGIEHPIVQGGMVWCSGWRLASAVSEAGGLGLLGAGSMHPDTSDAALIFKAPKAGTVTCIYSFASASDQGDGVILYIKHNGQKIEIGNEKNGGLLITYGSPADGEITLTVAEGDEIAFIINRNGSNAFDATDTSVTVAYQ